MIYNSNKFKIVKVNSINLVEEPIFASRRHLKYLFAFELKLGNMFNQNLRKLGFLSQQID